MKDGLMRIVHHVKRRVSSISRRFGYDVNSSMLWKELWNIVGGEEHMVPRERSELKWRRGVKPDQSKR